jgi:hypothetical protein
MFVSECCSRLYQVLQKLNNGSPLLWRASHETAILATIADQMEKQHCAIPAMRVVWLGESETCEGFKIVSEAL